MDVVPTTIGEMVANGPSTFSMPPPKFDGEMLYQAIRSILTDYAKVKAENEWLTKDRDYWKQEQGRVHAHWRTAETDLKKAEADLALAEPVLAELTELLSECLFFLPSFDDPWGAITFKGGTFGIRRLVTDALVRLDAQQARAKQDGKEE